MRRLLSAFFALLLLSGMALAQSPLGPRATIELEADETIPGQSVDLVITVLVPTWMTRPVDFPSMEAPNMMVRLPERATHPISQRIDRQNWSGVTRRYRITPMIPGRFIIPEQELRVTWADPDTNTPREDWLTLDRVILTGVIPDGAEGLKPFIAANRIQLTQELVGPEAPLKPGDSLTRILTVEISGTSPMFLPNLLDPSPVQGIATYPSESTIDEAIDGATLSGTRREQVTYLAQSGGDGMAPAVSLDWYNLSSGEIETAKAPSFSLMVDAPIATTSSEIRPETLFLIVGALSAGVIGLVLLARPMRRRWQAYREARRARYLSSPDHAYRQLLKASRARDLDGCLRALDLWAARLKQGDPRRDPAIAKSLTLIGAARYGQAAGAEAAGWSQLHAALSRFPSRTESSARIPHLPPLNPR